MVGIHSPGAGAPGRRRQAGLRHVKTVVAQRVTPGGSWEGREAAHHRVTCDVEVVDTARRGCGRRQLTWLR